MTTMTASAAPFATTMPHSIRSARNAPAKTDAFDDALPRMTAAEGPGRVATSLDIGPEAMAPASAPLTTAAAMQRVGARAAATVGLRAHAYSPSAMEALGNRFCWIMSCTPGGA